MSTIAPRADALEGMTGAQRAAAVLLAVGPDLAGQVLQHMSSSEVERLALEVAILEHVPAARMKRILDELRTEAAAHQQLVMGGEAQARELLRRLHGDDADEIIERLLATVQTTPFHFLRLHEPKVVAQHLRDEHPQTIALILAHLSPKFAAQILAGLDAEVQGQVARRVATLEGISPATVKQVESALADRLGTVQKPQRRHGGVRELAGLLNQVDRGTERAILASLDAADPALAEQVRALMFTFEDLVTLEDRALQEVLRQIEASKLALAVKGVNPAVREAIERNLSERARQNLAEEIELLGAVRLKDVEAAQTEVVRGVRALEEAGTITINRGGDSDLVE